jgi:hypothetical protein
MNAWTLGWLVWLAYFGVLEGAAVVRSIRAKRAGRPDERDTLSEHVWIWFGTDKRTRADSWAYVRRFALLAFLAWISVHFLGGGQFV